MQAFKKGLFARRISIMLIILMSLMSMVPRVEAGFIPSAESQTELMRDQDMEIIQRALENKVITQRLEDLGFSDQEIQERMDQLSDQEVHNLAKQIDSLTQGGIFGVVIAVLVIVLLIVVILRLT
jgi:predicted PurR-regulated permease PerM